MKLVLLWPIASGGMVASARVMRRRRILVIGSSHPATVTIQWAASSTRLTGAVDRRRARRQFRLSLRCFDMGASVFVAGLVFEGSTSGR